MDTLLNNIRVLDLTDEKGWFCGRILADMGADVLKVEKPGGDRGRNIGPFFHDIEQPEKSLYWFAYNVNKRGITLDIEQQEGQEIFKQLAAKADVVVESFSPGCMEEFGLGYETLSRISPKLVFTSISPFGATGPYRSYRTDDLISTALSSYLWLVGKSDSTPLRISAPQAFVNAGAEAAAATLLAHYFTMRFGEGQHVDVSTHQPLIKLSVQAIPVFEMSGVDLKRCGQRRPGVYGGDARFIWPAKNGYITFTIGGVEPFITWNLRLIGWMEKEGIAEGLTDLIDWHHLDMSKIPSELMLRIEASFEKFFLTKTKEELFDWGLNTGTAIYPVAEMAEVCNGIQLKARSFWTQVYHPELGTAITYPGPFVRTSSATPVIRKRPPLIGEHNEDIYRGELGLSSDQLIQLKQRDII